MFNVFEIALYIALLAFSLLVLAIVSQFTIKSIEQLIEITHLSEASVGFVIMSVITGLPEIFVAISSILHGKPGFSVGDILGSNVCNIGFVAGLLATMGYLKRCSSELLTELVDILFLSSIIPLILVVFGEASFFVGLGLLGIFFFSIREMTKGRRKPLLLEKGTTSSERLNPRLAVLKMAVGITIIIATAELVITSASKISEIAGIAPILIGAKVIAIGTSMPELFLDFAAVRRGRVHLALGNLIGSNLTNTTLTLGIVFLTSPIKTVNLVVFAEIVPFVLITTLILWRYLVKGGVSQLGGIALILTYVVFQAIIVA